MARPTKTAIARDERYDRLIAEARLIVDPEEARELWAAFGDRVVALDFETTGLDPKMSRVRLSCTYHPDFGTLLFDHDFCGAFNDVAHLMLGPMWAVYNAKFEVTWFDHALGEDSVDLIDVDFLAKAKRGGSHSSLAVMCKRDLHHELSKEQRVSDWSRPRLSQLQINYAAEDAIVTYDLYALWMKRCTQEQRDAAFTFQDAVRPTVECEEVGMVLDIDVHAENIKKWRMKQEIMLRRVRHFLPTSVVSNLNSNKQLSDMLKTQLGKETLNAWPKTAKTGQLSLERKLIAPLVAKSPYPFSRFMNALLRYRYYAKYLSTYGETLLTKQHLEDKITYRLNIGQAATGRYSSSSINIQNIPRAPWVRRAFIVPYGYDRFVIADYSGIEVRVLAELSGDERLLRDCIYGDVHSGSASAIYGIDEDEFIEVIKSEGDKHSNIRPYYKELRSKAKGFTFQNVYGAGAGALSVVLKCSVAEAEDALRKWAERYPKAYNYRHIMFDQMSQKGYLPVCDGRTIFVHKNDRTLPVASNYGVQGAAASVMLRAMSRVYDLRNASYKRSQVGMSATVHDELILATQLGMVDPAKVIIEKGMTQGWLDIFPGSNTDNLVEAHSGTTWAGAK